MERLLVEIPLSGGKGPKASVNIYLICPFVLEVYNLKAIC